MFGGECPGEDNCAPAAIAARGTTARNVACPIVAAVGALHICATALLMPMQDAEQEKQQAQQVSEADKQDQKRQELLRQKIDQDY